MNDIRQALQNVVTYSDDPNSEEFLFSMAEAKEALATPGWTVEQEREACAREADEFARPIVSGTAAGTVTQMTGKAIAEAIRARQTPPDNEPPAEETARQDLAAEKDGAAGQTVERLIHDFVVGHPHYNSEDRAKWEARLGTAIRAAFLSVARELNNLFLDECRLRNISYGPEDRAYSAGLDRFEGST